ncbi:hypothetical protein C7N43_27405 [Sphingobacteriales bacterium UPWRP_1]|nr:hypothetical protein BVG80_05255 [Sphingobacteriales bacterium TSM_CSM]PSJ73768.1 hypothetical protein C7N43_27405 [Sphingobacteriales bacterium UPWRP_1]
MNGLSKYYIKKIITCFALEITATETSKKLRINRNTINKYYRMIREAIADYQEVQSRAVSLHNNDKKYFFGWHTNEGLIYTTQEDAQMFSLNIHAGKVYIKMETVNELKDNTEITSIKNAGTESIFSSESVEQAQPGSASFSKEAQPSDRDKHINEPAFNFFLYAKQKLIKFYGVKEEYTYLYLKELEFRFNNSGRDLSKLVLKILPHHSPEWNRTTRNRK